MALESAADFNSYLDTTTGHAVTAVFFEVQNYSGLLKILLVQARL